MAKTERMKGGAKYFLWGMIGGAAAFRFKALSANSFHADEALFASFARFIAVWRDPLLGTQPVDKPPLLFYLQALFYPLLGPEELAARLPNFIASLLMVALVGLWTWRLFKEVDTAVTAAAIIAFSPLSIQFSATAFTDMLLSTLLLGALVTMGGGWLEADRDICKRPCLSGLLFGLAVATKYQAWLFLPLFLGLGKYWGWQLGNWRRWLAGLLPVIAVLFLWEMARSGGLSLWSTQVANFGGLRFIWSWELWSRLGAWWDLWRWAWGSIWMGVSMATLLIWAGIQAWHGRTRRDSVILLFLVFGSGYWLFHWLIAVPVWDRYLLLLWPLAAIVAASQITNIGRRWLNANQYAVVGILLLLLLPGAWQARNGRFPIGGQFTADQGAAAVANALVDEPYGTVLYDHWYNWQWRYHLFDKRVYVSWFPHPDALVQDLITFGNDGNPHYLAVPASAQSNPILRAVGGSGFSLEFIPIADSEHIRLFKINREGFAK